MLHVLLNQRHPAYDHLFTLSETEEGTKDDSSDSALMGLKLLFCAWARMEDMADENRIAALEEVRFEWGRLAKDFLDNMD